MTRQFITMNTDIVVCLKGDEKNPTTNADFNMFIGTSGSDDPLIAFCDKEQLISSEQYSHHGRWRGWKHEVIVDKKEYFRRKLKGK